MQHVGSLRPRRGGWEERVLQTFVSSHGSPLPGDGAQANRRLVPRFPPSFQLSFGLMSLVLAWATLPTPARAADDIGVKLKMFVTSGITAQALPDSMFIQSAAALCTSDPGPGQETNDACCWLKIPGRKASVHVAYR